MSRLANQHIQHGAIDRIVLTVKQIAFDDRRLQLGIRFAIQLLCRLHKRSQLSPLGITVELLTLLDR